MSEDKTLDELTELLRTATVSAEDMVKVLNKNMWTSLDHSVILFMLLCLKVGTIQVILKYV